MRAFVCVRERVGGSILIETYLVTRKLSTVNPMAANPLINPTTAAGIIAIAWVASCVCTSKYTVEASSSNRPNCGARGGHDGE